MSGRNGLGKLLLCLMFAGALLLPTSAVSYGEDSSDEWRDGQDDTGEMVRLLTDRLAALLAENNKMQQEIADITARLTAVEQIVLDRPWKITTASAGRRGNVICQDGARMLIARCVYGGHVNISEFEASCADRRDQILEAYCFKPEG
jgi:hypothetical protein